MKKYFARFKFLSHLICSALVFIAIFSLQITRLSAQKAVPAKIIAAKNNGATFPQYNFIQKHINEEVGTLFYDRVSEYSMISLKPAAFFEFRLTAPDKFSMEIPYMDTMLTLELMQNKIVTDDFEVRSSDGSIAPPHARGLFYNGMVKGDNESLVAVTVFSGHLMAVISTKQFGNIVIAQVLPNPEINYHIIYSDKDINDVIPFNCKFDDEDDIISPLPEEVGGEVAAMIGGDPCVRIYFEVDYQLYQEKGGLTETEDYIEGIFNNTETIYENDDVSVIISEIFIWTSDDPFPETGSSDALYYFQDYRTSFDGDLAVLAAFDDGGYGGKAFLNGLCNSYSYSYCDLLEYYEDLPLYSFTVAVITHELGHNLGSHHTHWCGWDDGPIDNCGPLAGYPYETCGGCTCDAAPTPDEGTVMSYCHVVPDVGINFLLGFGPQPGDVIRNYIADAGCLEICFNNPDLISNITEIYTDPIVPGGIITGICEVTNIGGGDALISTLKFYISADCNLGLGDIFVGETEAGPILIGETFLANINADVLVIFPGTYYLIAVADGNGVIEELDETNNNSCYLINVLEPEALDLGVIDTIIPVSGCTLTSTETVIISVKNFGTSAVDEFLLDVSITSDAGTYSWSSNIETILNPGEVAVISTFIYDFSAFGEYIIEASANIPGDSDPLNNMVKDTIISYAAPLIVMDPEIIECAETILDAGNPGYNYIWNTGENTQTIVATESGIYSVIVSTPGGECSDTAEVNVIIDPAPIAAFTYIVDLLTISFTNTSEYEDAVFWDFGDGSNSTAENPVHIYAVEGDYNVSLTASDSCDGDVTSIVFSLDDGVAIYEEINNAFLIYPNPADEMIIVENVYTIVVNDVNIFNMLGQKAEDPEIIILDQNKFSIHTSTLITGTYYIEIHSGQDLYNAIIVVEH